MTPTALVGALVRWHIAACDCRSATFCVLQSLSLPSRFPCMPPWVLEARTRASPHRVWFPVSFVFSVRLPWKRSSGLRTTEQPTTCQRMSYRQRGKNRH
ncbi:hypothetical protein M427DRAFT_389097 [Gonapodya prolifera JEL478]|uniref:Uncharacterized protein n=1 Tax=Gonapodya prolifera (strain JEL478) TaxID=1344416 RepID=A0A139A7Q9_GONPJ|nr:hypothetical protein M427DRAFT_389097 [Gonapodya prolifera JEL478]|eukprot:KXS12820.1 hypothetical protein M427DRAFT_389097 [Gonapodya prolifera JEL478]